MVTYIYFVKCPNCEDEPFDFFDEAKEYAMGCMSQKPIITQTEVCRNDFGECTDHCDLGTVWSWEDMMTDAEPAKSVFTKDDLKPWMDDKDPEFDAIDNSVDFEPEISEVSSLDNIPDNFRKPLTLSEETNSFKSGDRYYGGLPSEPSVAEYGKAMDSIRMSRQQLLDKHGITVERLPGKVKYTGTVNGHTFCYIEGTKDFSRWVSELIIDGKTVDEYNSLAYPKSISKMFETNATSISRIIKFLEDDTLDHLSFKEDRKPIPEGMTIEQLVEEMEENEDTVECTWCEDLFDKSECRYEVNLGWLCGRCQSAIMSRGESLTFREGNYWDFLDESTDPKEVHDLGNTYDGGYPEEDQDLLTEAVFPHFRYAQDDLKQTLIQRVLEEPGMERYITPDGTIRAIAQNRNPNGPGQRTFGYVIDFEVRDTQIVVVLDRGNGVIHREELEDFMQGRFFGRPLYRNCAAGILLRRLLDVARQLNRELNPGIAARRNDAVANAVAVMNDTTLEELRTHIKDIVFRIPYDGYVEQDIADIDPEADENRKLAKQAVKKLKDLNASFFALDFADEANVEIRYVPSSEKANFIIHDWGNEAIIKFDCPISQLSDDAKQLIRETRYSNAELKETSKQVNNYRLAKELCLRYGAGFYLNNNQLHEASLSDIAAAANSEYGTGYSERDLLDNAGVEDMDFFDDLETPAQVYAQSYRNKRRRQAYAINKAKAAKTDSMLEELEDADSYKSHLVMCPECSFETLDVETGICINCGFNSLLTESIAEGIDFDNIPIVDAE